MKTKRILLVTGVALLAIQLIRPNQEAPVSTPENDLFVAENAPSEVEQLVKNACYDCHSNQTTWPWYAQIAPASWIIANHVNEGREHLNFSEWATFSAKKRDHKLEEIPEEITKGEMPMAGYVALHEEAKLTEEQKMAVINWFKSIR